MNKRQFVEERRPSWRRFERLVTQLDAKGQRKGLRGDEVGEYSRLLRELSNDLAVVRSREWGEEMDGYLNNLVSRGYNAFYSQPGGDFQKFLRFVAVGFPRVFRRNIAYFLWGCLLFFGPFALSWGVVNYNPDVVSRILPPEQLEQMDQMYSPEMQQQMGFGEERAGMAGFYVQHNVGIALSCFAMGILFGVGTVYTLIFNGIAIGAIAGFLVNQGHGDRFLSFAVSHGSFELTAIAVAGGAGLMLGNALLHPGQRSAMESLRIRGFEAVQIAAGAAVMLMVAALIEAFWSPSGVPMSLKYIVGALLWALVFLYLGLAGRGGDQLEEKLGTPAAEPAA